MSHANVDVRVMNGVFATVCVFTRLALCTAFKGRTAHTTFVFLHFFPCHNSLICSGQDLGIIISALSSQVSALCFARRHS